MKKLKVTWKGTAPLLMHNCQCVNPLNPISILLKKYTSKRKKTEEDLIKIADLEWEGSAYWREDIGLFIPAENVEATIQGGAKQYRKGTDVEKYVRVEEPYIPLDYGENLTKEQLITDYRYRDTRMAVVQKSRVVRTRPRFDRWEIAFTLRYEETKMDLVDIVNAIEYAGQYVGLCDYRPRYGTFTATVEEID